MAPMDWMIHYLEGTASAEEHAQLLTWLKECDANRKEFKEVQAIWLSSSAAFGSDVDTELALAKLHTRLAELNNKLSGRTARLKSWADWSLRVASVLLIVVASYLIVTNHSVKVEEKWLVSNKVLMPVGNKGEVSLPDGSTVWLNGGSVLEYPEQFSDSCRRVTLSGGAYFSIQKDSACPFVVNLGQLQVSVLGTKFDVVNYSTKDAIETTLVSGSVMVRVQGQTEGVLLEPNQCLSFNKHDGKASVNKVNALFSTNWINSKLVFDNDRLSDIFQSLERWYNIEIHYPERYAQRTRVTLSVRRETKEEIFQSLKRILPIQYLISDNRVVVTTTI